MKINCNFIPNLIVEAQVNENCCCIKGFDPNNSLPKPRSGHRLVYNSKSIYCIGGYNPSLTVRDYDDLQWHETIPLFQELWKFNIVCNCWSRIKTCGDMPLELASHSAILYNSQLIVYGGTASPFGTSTTSNETYICNLQTGQWRNLVTAGTLPLPTYGQAMCEKEGKMYIVGGTTGYQYYLDIFVLDFETLTWKSLVPSLTQHHANPDSRYRHEIVEYEGCLYVFGGGTNEYSFKLDKLPTFHIEGRYWRYTKTGPDPKTKLFPKARKCHILIKYKNYVYIQGGIGVFRNLNDLWRLDLTSMTWRQIPTSTERTIYFHSAAVTEEGCIYMYGGVWSEPQTRTSKIFKVYIDVPSLLTMSWEAVQKCYPNLHTLNKSQMLKFGIPPTIVQWLKP